MVDESVPGRGKKTEHLLAFLSVGAAAALIVQSQLVLWGADPVIPARLNWLLGGLTVLGPLLLVSHRVDTDRALGLLVLLALGSHLLLLGPAFVTPPTNGAEIRSLLAGELGRGTFGFPLRAMIALLGSLAFGPMTARLLVPRQLGVFSGALLSAGLVVLVVSYASGGLGF